MPEPIVTLPRPYWLLVLKHLESLYAELRERNRELENERRECARLRARVQ